MANLAVINCLLINTYWGIILGRG